LRAKRGNPRWWREIPLKENRFRSCEAISHFNCGDCFAALRYARNDPQPLGHCEQSAAIPAGGEKFPRKKIVFALAKQYHTSIVGIASLHFVTLAMTLIGRIFTPCQTSLLLKSIHLTDSQ